MERGDVTAFFLLAPVVLVFLALCVVPVGNMIRFSVFQKLPSVDLGPGLTLANYASLAEVACIGACVAPRRDESWLTTAGAIASAVAEMPGLAT